MTSTITWTTIDKRHVIWFIVHNVYISQNVLNKKVFGLHCTGWEGCLGLTTKEELPEVCHIISCRIYLPEYTVYLLWRWSSNYWRRWWWRCLPTNILVTSSVHYWNCPVPQITAEDEQNSASRTPTSRCNYKYHIYLLVVLHLAWLKTVLHNTLIVCCSFRIDCISLSSGSGNDRTVDSLDSEVVLGHI